MEGAKIVRTKFITPDHRLYAKWRGHMYPQHRLLWDIMVATGLRLSDALSLTRPQLLGEEPVVAKKTGKPLTLQLPEDLRQRALAQMPEQFTYVFQSRDWRRKGKPITRQSVEYHYRKNAKALDLPGINAHSARKLYAWQLYQATNDLAAVQAALQHTHLSTTCLYLLSDRIAA